MCIESPVDIQWTPMKVVWVYEGEGGDPLFCDAGFGFPVFVDNRREFGEYRQVSQFEKSRCAAPTSLVRVPFEGFLQQLHPGALGAALWFSAVLQLYYGGKTTHDCQAGVHRDRHL